LDKLKDVADGSVQCIVTSPPYWGLRDYSRCACSATYEGAPHSGYEYEGHLSPRPRFSDPNCPKCYGTGKDDSLTVTWDAKEGCEHEWRDKRYYTERSAGASGDEAFSVAGVENAERIKSSRWRSDSACEKCGAWRGQLGLEPTPEL